jgi:hypothetical protein
VQRGPFAASQYLAGDDVVLLGWWGPQPGGARPRRIRLAGLDAGASYRDVASGERHWGATLLTDGLTLPEETASTFGSTLVRLVRDQPQPAAGERSLN